MPTLIFLDSNGNEIDRIIGYLPPDKYQKKVNEIRNNVNTLNAGLKKYENEEKTADLLFNIAQKYTDRNESNNAKKYYLELLNLFPNADSEIISTAEFELAFDEFKNGNVELFDNFINNFPESSNAQTALSYMIRFYKGEGNQVSELRVHKRMLDMYPDNPRILNGYAWRMSEMELNLEDALIKAKYAVELAANDKQFQAGILDTEAELLWKMGRFDDAILTIEKSLRIDPSNDYFINQKLKFILSKKKARKNVPA
jgi:tetratricopeptide (TPR) repeat protein